MWREIFRFEVRYHLSQPLFHVTALALFIIALLWITSDVGVESAGAPGGVNHDAPLVIVYALSGFTALGLFVMTAFVASSVLRDFSLGTHMLFFTKPVRKFDYLIGRFAGSMTVSLALFLAPAVGIAAGRFAPWQDADRVGPFMVGPYLYGLAVMVLPNLLMMGAVFFGIAAWSRSLLVTYICVVVFVGVQDAAESLVRNFERAAQWSLLEPLGVAALRHAVRYWTIAEYNTALPPLTGTLLANRILWLGIGFLVLASSYSCFSYSRAAASRFRARKRIPAAPSPETASPETTPREMPMPAVVPRAARRIRRRPALDFTAGAAWRQTLRQARMETAAIVRSAPFVVMLALALLFVLTFASYIGQIRGTPVYPVTHLMLRAAEIGAALFLLVVITLYSGELIWKERSEGLAEIYDALPVVNGVRLGAKIASLVLVAAIFVAAAILAVVGYQICLGFFDIEFGLYAKGFLVITLYCALLAILAVFVQVVTNNKFLGFLLMIVVIAGRSAMDFLHLDHPLCRYPGPPGMPYSDMNGFGHYVEPFLWVKLYWSSAATILLVLSVLFWVRGAESSITARLAIARARWRGPVRAVAVVALLGSLTTGAYVFYNTNILNEYVSKGHEEELQADYEKKCRQYRDLPQPRVADVRADVDIFPRERRVEIRGSYRLENRTAAPVGTLHLTINPEVKINSIGPAPPAQSDPRLGYYIYDLPDPIAPGGSMELRFDLTVQNRGFESGGSGTSIVYNGTFFNNQQFFPALGYDANRELVDRNTRRKHALPPVPRMARVDDPLARRNTYISTSADWVDFETTVSTSPDQIAIAPGYLQKEWETGGRRYFHYKMDAPILNFFSYLSAEYAVRRDRWNDVAIEVYYHEPHHYNVEKMIDAVKKSLDYYTGNFGPYQHRQVRIIEFPRYSSFAQSFPNTIPYSEAVGFIARVARPQDIDYVFEITAHEVAHQWWAHQLIGGNVQGATLLSESLSQYSMLMVMEKECGRDRMRRFLRYELDGYLRGRGKEILEEMPLMLVENQDYIHYYKGSLVMYALRDYIGEENLNRALARYLEHARFQDPPYTNSLEFLGYLREAVPARYDHLIEDMFETITLFSNRAVAATWSRQESSDYLVHLEVEARKLRAAGKGAETEIPVDDWIDIGVFGEQEKVLFMDKRHITTATAKFDLVVPERPVQAGIDPYNKLIDRDPDDNVRNVSEEPKP